MKIPAKHMKLLILAGMTVITLIVVVFGSILVYKMVNPYEYTVEGNSVTITGYNGIFNKINIPGTIGGKPVTSIDQYAFAYTSLESIRIPITVTSIGNRAFSSCSSLENVTIPRSVTSIGDDVFANCWVLTVKTIDSSTAHQYAIDNSLNFEAKSDTQPQKNIVAMYESQAMEHEDIEIETELIVETELQENPITLIENPASDFEYEVNGNNITLTKYIGTSTTVNIPGKIDGKPVTIIDQEAFWFHYPLTSITIPISVTTIGNKAFARCLSLTNITIPNSVTSIGDSVFSNCESLTSITIPNSVTSIGDNVFYNCTSLKAINVDPNNKTYASNDGVVFNKSMTKIIGYPKGKVGNYTIPNSITHIGNRAFSGCTSLTSITIPSSVTSIGDGAFSSCTSLTSITIPSSVTSIGSWAFSSCESLRSITIPNSVTSISENTFSNCTSLTNITIPNSVTEIHTEAFYACRLLPSIIIPSGVTSIGEKAFNNCKLLKSINVDQNNKIYTSNDGVVFNKNMTEIIIWPEGKVGSYVIPDNVMSIGDRAFLDCTLLTSITIPSSVTTIGWSAFNGCASLTNITIPDSVTTIGNNAFFDCRSLTNITIPNSVTSIGANAFYSSLSVVIKTTENSTAHKYAKDNYIDYELIKP